MLARTRRRSWSLAAPLVVLTTALGTVLPPMAATAAAPAAASLAAQDSAPHHISRAQAAARALKALGVKTGTDPVRVFALNKTREPGTRITQAGRSVASRPARSTFAAPLVVQLTERSYLFYADDDPYTLFQHSGRIVVVPWDGSAPTVRSTDFVPLVNGVAPYFLRSQGDYLSSPTIFARDWSGATGTRGTPRSAGRAVPADPELAVAQALVEQDTCIVRAGGTDFHDYAGASRTTSAVGSFFAGLAARTPDLVNVTWLPGTSSASAFIDDLVADHGCRSVLLFAAGGGYATGAPAVNVGTSVSGQRNARVTVDDLTSADLSALVSGHPGLGVSLVLDAPYTGRFTGSLTGSTNVDALLTPGGHTRPSFGYLPGFRSGRSNVPNTANPSHLQENTNRILAGLRQFTASGAEIRHYQRVLRKGNARSLVAWMLVRGWALGSAGAIVPEVLGAPDPLVYSPVDVTAPEPNEPPTADAEELALDEDGSGTVTFTGTDPEEEPLTFEVVTQPPHGVLTEVDGGVRYTPAANYNGPDSFTYRAIDGDAAASAPAAVSITVRPVNDGPSGGTFSTNAHEDDSSTTIAAPGPLGDASDIDGDPLAATPDTGTGTAGGQFDVRANGSFDYDPAGAFEDLAAGEERVDTYDVVVKDPSGSQATVTIRVPVTGDNDAPVVDLGTTSADYTEDDADEVLAPALTIADVDNADVSGATVVITGGEATDVLTWTIPAGSGITASYVGATRTFTASGSASKADYRELLRSVAFHTSSDTPDESPRTVTFTVTDPVGDDGDDDLTLSVTSHDDLSAAVADTATVAEDSGSTPVDVLANDVDPDGNGPAVDTVTQPATGEGTVTVTGGGTGVSYATAVNFNGSTSFTYTLTSGSTATVTVTVSAVNDAPVLAGGTGSASYTEDDTTGVVVHSAITVADVDNANLSGATISIGTGFDATDDRLTSTDTATITGSYNATTGVLTLTGTDTKANYQSALRSVRYKNVDTSDPATTTRVLSFQVTDGTTTSNTVTSNVTITAVNDQPTITAGSTTASFTEAGSPVVVDNTVTVADVDNANLAGATVQVTGNYASTEDVLAFADTATITGTYNTTTGTLTLTGADTKANYRTALRSVTYKNTDTSTPSTATRTITFKVTDGALTSAGATSTVAVVAVNSAPVLSQATSTAAYTEDGTPVPAGSDLDASDPDSTDLDGAVVKLTTNRQSTDRLDYTPVSGITGTYDDATGILSLEGGATIAEYQSALRSITFHTMSDTPSTADRTLTVVVADAEGAGSNTLTRTITVAAANDAPVLVAGAQASTTFTEGDAAAAVVDSGITVSDPDSANIGGATVSLTTNFVTAEDVLVYPAALHGVTGTYDAGTGVLTLAGTATKAEYQDVLRSVQYRNTNTSTATGNTRTVEFQVSDAGGADSNVTTKGVVVVSINDAPVLGGGGNTLAYTEDDAATAVNGGITVTDTDDTDIEGATVSIAGGLDAPDDDLVFVNTASITGSYNSATGVLTLSGTDTKANYQAALRAVKYVNGDHVAPSSADRTVTFTVNDGEEDSNVAATTITIAQNADAPTLIAGTSNTHTFTEGGSAVVADDAIVVADVDNTNLAGASVVISAGSVTGDQLGFVNQSGISGSWSAGTATLTLTGSTTVANYQAALRTITFTSSSDDPGTSRTVSFTVSDSAGPSNAATHGVTVTPVNDAPSLSGGGALAYTENDAATAISPAVGLTDADNADIGGATVAITGAFSSGQDVLSFVDTANITGSYNATTGVLTLSGADTKANYRTALRAVRYANSSDNPATAQRTITYTATDGALSGSTTATVDVTAVNDAPVADDESFSGTDSAIGNTSFVGNDATDGAPDPAGPQKTISANILSGDTDAEGGTVSVVPGTVTSNDGGSVTVQADGDFTFTPATDTSCTDTSDFFDYTVSDGASPTPGTNTGRVTIAITDCVWYVKNNQAAGGNGASSQPYDTLAEADLAATTNGAYIYVYQGDGTTTGLTGGVSLVASQRLVGAAEDLTVASTTLETGADANRPAISGSVTLAAGNTVEGLAITTSGANAINGAAGDASGTLDDLVLTPTGAAGVGISLSGTGGTWDISNTTITATSGAQGFFANGAGTVNFTSAGTISITSAGPAFSALTTAVSGAIDTTTSTGGSYGWALNGVTGSIDLGTGTVSGHASTEVSVTAGSGDVTYAGTIGNGTGTSAVIQNRTAGAVTLSGNITDSNDAGGGITLSSLSGGSTTLSGTTKTINVSSGTAVAGTFTGSHTLSITGGGLDIDASGSAAGVALSGSNGTVVVSGTGNTIDTATGTPLSINGPDIGATGVTVQRISSNGAASGIVLADTGAAGGLTVTGTGTSASGGVINASTGPGISLSNTRNFQLSGVNVTNGGDDGIRASGVTNLLIAGGAGTGLGSAITGNGNAAGENGFDLTELAGFLTITNATVTGNYDNNLALTNDAATLTNFTIDDGSYGATNTTAGNDSIQIINTGAGNLTGTIKNADFMNSRGDHIQLITDNDPTTTSTQKLTIQNNTLDSTALSSTVLGGGIALGVGGGATQTVLVDNNDIDHAHGAPLSFNTTSGTSPNANWTVNNNRIGNTGEVKSGSVANSGFYINVNGNGNAKFNLTNNTIMQTDFTAVDAVQNDGDAAMNITMKGNVVTEPGTTIDYAYGLRFVIGSADGDAGTSCLDLGDLSTTALKNRFFGAGNSSQGYQDVRLRMAGDATVNLAGFTGGAHDNAAVNSWMQTRNDLGGTPTVSSSQFDADSFYGQVSSCPLPSVP
jgi:hypothetical protein